MVKNILILGGNRFVGKSLSLKLSKYNNVDVFNRSGTSADNIIGVIQGDRNNIEDIQKIDFDKYDCIVDMCLFFTSQFELIKDLIPKDSNYIFVSSGAADEKYIETFDDYGKDKLAVENMLSETSLNYNIIRPSYIVGEGNHRPRLGHFINRILNHKYVDVCGDGNYNINLVFVQDVVKCLELLVDDSLMKRKTYNVCGDKSINMIMLLEKLKRDYYPEGKVLINFDSENGLFPATDFEFDNSEIKKDYDLQFTDLDEGIKQYTEWLEN